MPSPLRSRRTAAAAALACGSLAAALLAPAADAAPARRAGTAHAFASAARAYHVPAGVLLAVGYLESRWEDHGGAPSTSGGFGPMNLTDAPAAAGHHRAADARGDGRAGSAGSRKTSRKTDMPASMRTLAEAAKLTGRPAATLRTDPAANIRGGAALLASYARAAHGGTLPTTLAGWYPAVARYSGSPTEAGARAFADDTWDTLRHGAARTLPGGERVTLAATPKAAADTAGLARLHLAKRPAGASGATPAPECPAALDCDFVPAAHQQTDPDDPAAYGNYDIADRPHKPKITHIVLHDTEETFDNTLGIFTDPARKVSAHYVVRSGDGHVTQMVPTKDIAWQAGNWYLNEHSVGIEQEGYATQGATWFTEEMYRSTARLVHHLAREYHIPLDRQHVIGHDNVPGTTAATVSGMHWDPGPYWDWSHFMKLAGAPLRAHAAPRPGKLVTVDPDFARNLRTTKDCEKNTVLPRQAADFVWLRTAPSDSAPLFGDPGLVEKARAAGTTCTADWGDKASAGQQFAVAGRKGDWTAVWWDGSKVWFKDPAGHRTAFPSTGWTVTPKPGRASIPVYGRAYPEKSAYPKDVPVQDGSVALTQYSIRAGQAYASGGPVPTDYYYAENIDGSAPGDRTDVRGRDRYLQIQYGHRIAFVRADDVTVRRAR